MALNADLKMTGPQPAGCMTVAFSTEKDLEDLLYHAIMDQIKLVGAKAGEAARIQKRMSSSIQEKMDRLNSLERQIDSLEQEKPKQDRIRETVEQFRTETGLTYEMAQAFTEAVFIQRDGTVQIKWKFKDWISEVDK